MNNQATISTEGITTILIDSVGGDLRVHGHDRDEILVRSDDSVSHTYRESHVSENGENREDGEDAPPESQQTVRIGSFGGDCHLHVPAHVHLEIGSIGGDGTFHATAGSLLCNNVGGDLKIDRVGGIHVRSVGGDLRVRHAEGTVQADSVGGDARVAESSGNVNLVSVGGDMAIANVNGATVNGRAGGDAVLRLSPADEGSVDIHVGGDIHCMVSADTTTRVRLESEARAIRISGWDSPHLDDQRIFEATLGDGDPNLFLTLFARGDILLAAQGEQAPPGDPFSGEFRARWEHDFDFGNFDPHFEFEFDSDMAERFSHLSDEMARRVQDKVQKAMRQAEGKMAEAMRRAEERIARAEEKAARMDERRHSRERDRNRRRDRRYATPPVPPMPPMPPMPPRPPVPPRAHVAPEKTVSDEERMMVLRMVEEGKINIEQAEQLLQALKK